MDNSPSKRQRCENTRPRVSNEMVNGTFKIETIDLTGDEPATSTSPPTANSYLPPTSPTPVHILTESQSTPTRKRKARYFGLSAFTETRLRQHLAKPPQSFYTIYERARRQRFYVLQRTPGGSQDFPQETFEMTGSTGNIYTVRIKQVPTCDCSRAIQGNQCKHVVYVRPQHTIEYLRTNSRHS